MECDQCFSSQPFIALTVVGRSGGPLERQKQDSHVYQNWHIATDFSEKSESSLHRRRSLRNSKEGMEFLSVMYAKMNTTSNYVNLYVCSKY